MIGYSLSSFNDFPLDKFVKSLQVLGGSSGPALTMKGNMSKRGWWKIDYTIEPNEIDLEHIAEEIKKGNDQGEIIQEDEA